MNPICDSSSFLSFQKYHNKILFYSTFSRSKRFMEPEIKFCSSECWRLHTLYSLSLAVIVCSCSCEVIFFVVKQPSLQCVNWRDYDWKCLCTIRKRSNFNPVHMLFKMKYAHRWFFFLNRFNTIWLRSFDHVILLLTGFEEGNMGFVRPLGLKQQFV